MVKRLRLVTSVGMVAFAVLLSGCELGKNSAESSNSIVVERPGVSLKGKLTIVGDKLFIQSEGKVTEVTSKRVDLNSVVGKDVEVYGEFSGTTLYVDEVK